MQSFRTELENSLVAKDIIELERKIRAYRDGTLNPDKFRSLRLARGVYGQRQQGVQMIRIKLPFGKLSPKQLIRIADISDEYSNGNLHLTTRQDIQLHFVSLDKTPELWAKLEQDQITIREACGNTVRNITASAIAGIDPKEPFDVSPYADALFRYLLRKPFGQELGRKIKIAFSSSDDDTAYTFMHDLGFIPRVKIVDGKIVRGFKVLIGGGLGAQPYLALTASEFLDESEILPFTEAVIRTFDRYGERTNRNKARLKYLVSKTGLSEFLRLVAEERSAVPPAELELSIRNIKPEPLKSFTTFSVVGDASYQLWLKTNVFEQKQQGYHGVNIRVRLGNLDSMTARKLATIASTYAADDLRVTINQGLLLRFVPAAALPALYRELRALKLADPGFDSAADITACPGTDTCNLGIASSTGIAKELEKVIESEFPELLHSNDIRIKISGCMNSCGQHSLAHIGFHGSSFKNGTIVVPALQLLLGGGALGNGVGRVAEKIIKIPSKRGPAVLRSLLNDFTENAEDGEYFNNYYDRKGKDYFYQLLKPFADPSTLVPSDYIDWGHDEQFKTEIGVGECAGVMIDLVATLLFEAEEKLDWASSAIQGELFSDSIYHSYAAIISAAKAALLDKSVPVNTHIAVINDFQQHFVNSGEIYLTGGFKEFALQINQQAPSADFAKGYLKEAREFIDKIRLLRARLQQKAQQVL